MKSKKVGIAVLGSIAAVAMTASSAFAATVPDFQHLGFPKIVAKTAVPMGHAATLRYGDLVVRIPAGAFSADVEFELLEGPLQNYSMNTPMGQKDLVDFAFKVIDTKTMDLIGKFKKPVVVSYTSHCVNEHSEYWDVAPNGKLLMNPLKPVIKGHTLNHGNLGAPVGWLITTPSMNSTMSGSMSNMKSGMDNNMGIVVKNGKFNPSVVHIKRGEALKFIFDGMGKDRFVVKGVTISPVVKVGQSWTYKFTKAGTYHVQMADMGYISMTVVVK